MSVRRVRIGALGATAVLLALGCIPATAAAPGLAGTGIAGPASSSTASPSTAAETTVTTATTDPLALTLGSLTPLAPQPGQRLRLTGTVRNVSAGVLTNLAIGLRLGPALTTRSEFQAYGADPTATLPFTLTSVGSIVSLSPRRLAAGASTSFTVSVPVSSLGLPADWQVRELGLEASATAADGLTETGQLRTYLPWAPRHAAGVGQPVKVAWVWPLIDSPHVDANGTFVDDSLTSSLAPAGLLGRLLSAAELAQSQARPAARHQPAVVDVPVAWALDPMLVSDATQMTTGYQVRTSTGTTAGRGGPVARSWLDSLRSAVSGQDVIPLPYADPDVVAASRAGFDREIGVATTTGRALLRRELPGATLLPAEWPPGGTLDQQTVDALYAAGDTTLVLNDSALPVLNNTSETPTGRAVLSTDAGEVRVLLSDSGLSEDVESGADQDADAPLSLQRYLAETLMIQGEAPSDQRSVIVAPSQRWDPSSGFARAVLSDTGRVPWISPTTLSAIQAARVPSGLIRGPLTYSAAARHDQLPASYLAAVGRLQSAVSNFSDILPSGSTEARSFQRSVIQSLSSAWRGGHERDRQLAVDQGEVDDALSKVSIASAAGSFVTLTSHTGSVPVTIANNLDVPVTIELKVEPTQRLALPSGGRVLESIAAHQQKLVELRAQAKTSGVFPLDVRLLTPAGKVYGPSVQINVRSTVYGTVTLVITAAATIALLLAVAVRLTRRAVRARRPVDA